MSVVVKRITKFYGQTKAVENLSFEAKKGEVVGFLGPNGAGKTTTIRIITGFIAPTSGTVEIMGRDIRKEPYEVRNMIGYLPESNPLYNDMNVIDYLEYIAELQDVPKKEVPSRIKVLINTFGLQNAKHKDISELSKGYRQRVGLAQAMINDPPVLVLDEPTTGLDPNQILEFRNFIQEVGKEKTVILSTHALSEVQVLCNRVIIVGRGRMLADAPITILESKFRGREGFFVEIERTNGMASEAVQSLLEGLPDIIAVAPLVSVDRSENVLKYLIEANKEKDIRRQVFKLCVEQKWNLVDLHRQHVRIEDIFHQLTMGKQAR